MSNFITTHNREKTMETIDPTALFRIGYGLYVITLSDGAKFNGMICNTVMQVASTPLKLAVSINKANYSHDVIRKSGKMNVNVLDQSAPFDVFKCFGFRSGRDADKLAGVPYTLSANGLPVLSQNCNAFFSLEVESYSDVGSHGLFICTLSEAKVLGKGETMTYSYYQANVKPKPAPAKKKGFVCTVCGYVYEGDTLPDDFICPLCKHPASDFKPLDDSAAPAAEAPKTTPKQETTMKKYVCDVCGYTYDPEVGDPENGIAAGTAFEDLPADWVCPVCSVPKDNFKPEE